MTFLGKIFRAIGKLFEGLRAETKRLVPIAINIVEGIKKVMDSPVDDIILAIVEGAIPGDADDILINKIKSVVEIWLPKILLELKMIESIANIEDRNAQLQAVLDQLKLSSDETKAIIYHGLASLILEKLSDGKLSWSDAIAIGEYYYQNISKKG